MLQQFENPRPMSYKSLRDEPALRSRTGGSGTSHKLVTMSETAAAGLVLIVLSLLSLLHNIGGQSSDPDTCRKQCEAQLKFYRQFFVNPLYLAGISKMCLDKCPTEQTSTPTTTTTTITTITTSTTTEESRTNSTPFVTMTTTPTSTHESGVECGLQRAGFRDQRQRIVGGVEAAECEYPWMAFISIVDNICAGAILDSRHVLTAAHCVVDKNTNTHVRTQVIHVRVGSSSVSLAKVFPVINITTHPLHDPDNHINDAAILTVARDMTFSDCLAPICLPEAGADPADAELCVVAGWGTSVFGGTGFQPNLLKVELPIVDQGKCRDRYGQDLVNERTFCAGDYYSGGKDSCQGDSGAPLMCRKHGRYAVYGIVSTGRNCAKPRLPGIYTKVGHPDISQFIHNSLGWS